MAVDLCFVVVKFFNRLALTGVDTLLTRDISRSSAIQRAGRAGREVRVMSLQSLEFLTLFIGRRVLLPAVSGTRLRFDGTDIGARDSQMRSVSHYFGAEMSGYRH